MKTIEIQLFKFNELSEDAKQTAIESNAAESEYFWGYDAIKSLEKFMEHFNCKLSNYSIDWSNSGQSSINISIPEYMNELTEEELKSYIEDMGTYNEATLRGDGECKFTGYCADENAGDGARKDFYNNERDLNEILYSGYQEWLSSCQKDFEYQLSLEGYSEHCEANEYDFTEDGIQY